MTSDDAALFDVSAWALLFYFVVFSMSLWLAPTFHWFSEVYICLNVV